MHPAIAIIKDEIHRIQISYGEIANKSGIPLNRLRNMLTGRTPVSLEERDLICSAIGVSPVNIVIRRGDLAESSDYLDLSWMPEGCESY